MINRRLIRIKVLQVLYAYSKKNDGISSFSAEKELFHSFEKFYDLYLLMISMLTEMSRLEDEKIELRLNKNIKTKDDIEPKIRLSKNQVVSQIRDSQLLEQKISERKLNLNMYSDMMKSIFNQFIESELYKNYINSEEHSYSSDKKLVSGFYSDFLAENLQFVEFLEEDSIYWNDDSYFAIMMVLKTIDALKAENSKLKLLPLFKNSDDEDFAKKLLRNTISKKQGYLEIIRKNTDNWETERIAQIDLLILQIAITELIEFGSIPVKVTLNEFIEISKYYSTDKSKIFINGVLDKIIKQLKEEGAVKKTGRGLIE
jgi:N utilization substance protein B